MDLIQYVIGLAVFLSTSVVLAVCSHLFLLRHAKRRSAQSACEQK
ncbi:hypothetical protein [Pseudarthrobacter sp. NPDC057230]